VKGVGSITKPLY